MLLACHPCTYHFTILFVMSHTSIAACSWLRLAPRWWSSYNAVNEKTLALLSKTKCECVEKSKFEVRDGVSGVSYQDTENTAGWTPVRKKKKDLNCHPMFYTGFLLIIPWDGTSQTVILKRMKHSSECRCGCVLKHLGWSAWPASHN